MGQDLAVGTNTFDPVTLTSSLRLLMNKLKKNKLFFTTESQQVTEVCVCGGGGGQSCHALSSSFVTLRIYLADTVV